MNDLITLMTRGVAGAGVAAAGYFQPSLVLVGLALAAVLIVGVVLPGVWSRQPDRRTAAQATLQTLLRGTPPTVIPAPPEDSRRPDYPA